MPAEVTMDEATKRNLAARTIAVVGVVAAALCGLAGSGFAQEPVRRLSLDEALALALRQNPTVRAKVAELRSVQASEITAGLRPNPTATYLAEQFGGGSAALVQHTFSIGQPIELGGKRLRRVDAARAATRVTAFQLEDVQRLTILQVKSAFAGALVAREQLALAEDNLRALDETARLQRLRVDRGDLSELELLRIQVQRFTFERDAADARQALDVARITLRTTAGPAAIAEDFEVAGDLQFADVSLDPDRLRRLTVANRPDLRAAIADRERAQANHRLARANAWWDITPQLEYQRIGPDNTIGFGFSFPLRVFDRNQGEIERTRAEIARVEATRQATEQQALAGLDVDLRTAQTQRERVLVLRDVYLPKARQTREVVEYAYRRGGQSLLDFLDAQRSYRETALALLQATGAYLSAIYQLEADVGGPLDQP
jgi:cobalt-zinc-cadmium efflux system outer membrane protein